MTNLYNNYGHKHSAFQLILIIVHFILLTGCKSTKESCAKFYTYGSHSLNLKGLSINLKKRGFDLGDITIGNISVDPKFVVASEMLQRLDLLQYEICEQIRTSKNDSAKAFAKLKYINTLIEMVSIGKNPDSLLIGKVDNLEKKENERDLLKKSPPQFTAKLSINAANNFTVELKNVGVVPFEYGILMTVKKTAVNGNTFFKERRPIIHPGATQEIFILSTNSSLIPKDSSFVAGIMVWVESTYLREQWAKHLSYGMPYSYLINRKTKECTFISHDLE